MKMAKKFMALALAVVLSVGCAFCVSADGSRTKNITVSQEQSKIYEVLQKIEETDGFKELKEEYPEIAEVLQKVGEGKMDMKGFIDFLKTLATEEKDETRKAKLEDVIEKLEKNEWSIAEPISVDKKNKTIKVALEDLCYFAIIADAKEENTTK